MTEQTAHQSNRPRNLSVYVPNSATRQRYIIRTRAQALRLGRQPLRDAPTNSPTKMSAPSSPLLAHKVGHKSVTLSRKRARSPSMQGVVTNGSVKRLKPLVLTASLNHSTTPVSPTKITEGVFEVSEPPTARPSTPPRGRAPTDATSGGRPVGQTPPKIIKSTSTIDVFDAEPVLQPPPQELEGSCHASADAVHKSNEESIVVGPHEAPLPGPKLFDIRMCADDEQNVLKTGTSQLRRKCSTLSEDDTMVLNSPPKKAKTLTGPSVAAPKLSMIPRRVPPPGVINQPNIASLPPHAGLPSRELAPRPSSTVINESLPPTHPRPTPLLSPSTRTISSAAKPSLREVPARPSTSLGFSNQHRRTSLHNSTQMSLYNLSTALEKLSLPRVRASLNGPGTVTSDSASSTGGPSAVAPRLGTDIKQKLKPSTLPSRSVSGRLNGAATGVRRPIRLDEYFRIGLGQPSSGNMGPPRRTSSSIGPPPAPSAAVARVTQAASTSRTFSLSSTLPVSSSPPTNPLTAPRASLGEASLTREDRRGRRASIVSRSLADEGHLLRDVPTEDAVAQKYDGKTDKKKLTKLTVLKDCVVYVDVKTEDGAGAGELFVNILKGLGARILTRLTPSITHIVFKDGSPTTLAKHKLYENPRPFLVGVGWVIKCAENRQQTDESQFLVDEPEPAVLHGKRGKSMVPHPAMPTLQVPVPLSALKSLPSTQEEPEESERSQTSYSSTTPPACGDTLAPLERAKQKALAYAPKISSPLKTAIRPGDPDSGDEVCTK